MARRHALRTIGGVTLALSALWILQSLGWLTPITRPLSRAFFAITAPLYRTASPDLADDEVAELRKRFERASAENAKLRAAVEEVDELKTALDYRERFGDALLAARIISAAQDTTEHSVLIDRGSEDGVIVGLPAIVGDGVLLGKVSEVGVHTARIRLLTDSRSAVAVAIQSAQGTLGVLQGDRGLSLQIDLIPQTETLTPGDVVITSGIEPGIRRGLIVGTIEKIEHGTQDAFQTASVMPFIDAQSPHFVLLLTTTQGL